MEISNENGQSFGVYCGLRTGKAVLVTGVFAVITFDSDEMKEERGFLISFTDVPLIISEYDLKCDPLGRTFI